MFTMIEYLKSMFDKKNKCIIEGTVSCITKLDFDKYLVTLCDSDDKFILSENRYCGINVNNIVIGDVYHFQCEKDDVLDIWLLIEIIKDKRVSIDIV